MQFYFYDGTLNLKEIRHIKSTAVAKIRQVKKPKKGDILYFQDNSGKRYQCCVVKIKQRYLEFEPLQELSLEKTDFFLYLFIPCLLNKETESLLFKATEIGVEKFCFFESDYSRRLPLGKVKENKLKKWQEVCENACENSGKATIPEITFAGNLQKATNDLKKTTIPFVVLHLDFNSDSQKQNFQNEWLSAKKQLALFVGPKRGFSEEEIKNIDAPKISLGVNLMKPETAALSALAILQHRFGNFQFDGDFSTDN